MEIAPRIVVDEKARFGRSVKRGVLVGPSLIISKTRAKSISRTSGGRFLACF